MGWGGGGPYFYLPTLPFLAETPLRVLKAVSCHILPIFLLSPRLCKHRRGGGACGCHMSQTGCLCKGGGGAYPPKNAQKHPPSGPLLWPMRVVPYPWWGDLDNPLPHPEETGFFFRRGLGDCSPGWAIRCFRIFGTRVVFFSFISESWLAERLCGVVRVSCPWKVSRGSPGNCRHRRLPGGPPTT